MQSDEYKTLREECYEANLLLPKNQLIDLTFGNVSVVNRSRSVFAIKPSGMDYQTMRPEDIVVVDFDGKVVEGKLKPSSDTPTHRRLYLAFPTVGALVHTHSRHATAFAQAGKSIPCLGTTHADYFFGEIPVTRPMNAREVRGDYEWETGNVIVERFATLDHATMCAILIHGHGSYVWGPSGAKAVENALALEIAADMAWKAMQINPHARPIAQHLLERHFFRKHGIKAYYGQTHPVSMVQPDL